MEKKSWKKILVEKNVEPWSMETVPNGTASNICSPLKGPPPPADALRGICYDENCVTSILT